MPMRSAGRASSRRTTGRRPSRATLTASPTVGAAHPGGPFVRRSAHRARPCSPLVPHAHPVGPESVGLDAVFVGLTHLYGLPERSTGLNLPTTRYAITGSTAFLWAAVPVLTRVVCRWLV